MILAVNFTLVYENKYWNSKNQMYSLLSVFTTLWNITLTILDYTIALSDYKYISFQLWSKKYSDLIEKKGEKFKRIFS